MLFLAAATARADDAVIEHEAPEEADAQSSVRIGAKIREVWEPVKLVVNVRHAGQPKFERIPMGVDEIKIEGSGAATVATGTAGELQFYIEALDLAGSAVASDGNAKRPHVIRINSPVERRRHSARERWKVIAGPGKDPCRDAADADDTTRFTRLLACAEIDFERWYGKVRPGARAAVDAYEEAEAELSDLAQCALGDGSAFLAYWLPGIKASARAAEAVAGVTEKPLLKDKPDMLSSADSALRAAADAFAQSEKCKARASDLLASHDRWTQAHEGICNQVPRARRTDCKLALEALRARRLTDLQQSAR